MNGIENRLINLPNYCYDWCMYKGETYFAMPNYERSFKSNRAIIDLYYCATACMAGDDRGSPLKTVMFIQSKFSEAKKYR